MGEIPKKIHYCWFGGGEKSDLMKKCIKSWKDKMPTYEIIEWNESNFVSDNQYFRQALEMKKYAFASDYARLKIVYEEGGVYLDTDVEIIKDLTPILANGGFMALETSNNVATGLGFAAEKGNEIVGKILDSYKDIPFITKQGIDNMPCPQRNTLSLKECGFCPKQVIQKIENITIYPSEYFCPMDYDTGKITLTNNTYAIHHYSYSWADEESKEILEIKRKIFGVFPKKIAQLVFNVVNKVRKIILHTRNKK